MRPPPITLRGDVQLNISDDGHTADLLLCSRTQPLLNPLSEAMLLDITDAARWLACDHAAARLVKVVVIRPADPRAAWSVGAALDAVESDENSGTPRLVTDRGDVGARMASAVESIPAVTIAHICGFCIGGGFVLASCCDFRVADRGTRFSIPEIKLGIPLTWGALPRLVRDCGPLRAKELVMLGREFTADEALRFGLVNELCDGASALSARVGALREELCRMSRMTLRMTKGSINSLSAGAVAAQAWSDAATLVAGFEDEESRAVSARYIQALAQKKGRGSRL